MKKYRGKEGKVNMCKGLREWLEEDEEVIRTILETIMSYPTEKDEEIAKRILKQ